jgi:hypothetical protein
MEKRSSKRLKDASWLKKVRDALQLAKKNRTEVKAGEYDYKQREPTRSALLAALEECKRSSDDAMIYKARLLHQLGLVNFCGKPQDPGVDLDRASNWFQRAQTAWKKLR